MRFGHMILNQSLYDERHPLYAGATTFTDADRIKAEFELLDIADRAGFDTCWTTEHHFSAYMTNPSPTQILAHVLGRTRNVDVGTAVIVLPWHNPVRVAEEVAMLDVMAGDRQLFAGFGRGASTLEFGGFGVEMETSRARYGEALEIVRGLLSQEEFEYDGEFYKVPRMTTRPRPRTDLRPRMYNAWFSPSSLEFAARDGVGALFAVMRELHEYPQEIARFNAIRDEHGYAPIPVKVASFVYCADSQAQAEEEGLQYLQEYMASLEDHYHWADDKYSKISGYEFYNELGKGRKEATEEQMREGLNKANLFGTPDDIVDKVVALSEASSCDEVFSPFIYGSMPFEKAEAQLKLFCEKALPRIQKLPVPSV